MKRYELAPNGTQKSFYGKAVVEIDNAGNETLYSYNTPIIKRLANGSLVKLWGGWSNTTGKHIKVFCGLNKAGYCDLSYLLNNHSPIAYTCGVYGWNFDVYEVYGVTICTGYRNMPGARLEKISEYEEKARAIMSWEDKRPFEEKQIAVENLLKEFCKLNGGVIYE